MAEMIKPIQTGHVTLIFNYWSQFCWEIKKCSGIGCWL